MVGSILEARGDRAVEPQPGITRGDVAPFGGRFVVRITDSSFSRAAQLYWFLRRPVVPGGGGLYRSEAQHVK